MDLYRDWNDHLATELGLTGEESEGANYYFFQNLEREIDDRARSFHIPKNFECPTNLRAGFDLLKEHVESGKSLKPFLSKRIDKLKSVDPLFAQWNIRHFHLGNKLNGEFIKRTGPLAFAKITSNAVYILDIDDHGKWASKKLIQIAHENWPFLLDKHRLTSGTVVEEDAGSQANIDRCRAKFTSTFVRVDDGTGYLFGDMSVSGHNIHVFFACSHMMRVFAFIEREIQEKIAGDDAYKEAQPKLSITGEQYLVECVRTGFCSDVSDKLKSEFNIAKAIVINLEG